MALVQARKEEALASDLDVLQEMNGGRVAKFDIFWEKCAEYISECTEVPERRHSEVCFMAKVLSTRCLNSALLNLG